MGPVRRLGCIEVTAIGLGCMNLSHAYGHPLSREDATALLLRALDLGVTHIDTAALYGFGANEELLGEVLRPHRRQFILASKCGMQGIRVDGVLKRVIDGRPQTLRATCEAALRRLRTEVIDLYYLHRLDRQVPLEDSIGELVHLVAAGKIRQIGLSEVSADTVRRAHRVHPIAAVQSEYSVMTRNPEIAVLEACRDIGASFVAFSPVARGMLAATPIEIALLSEKDIRHTMPRYSKDNGGANFSALSSFRALARRFGCTPVQLGLQWLLQRGEHVLAIPGTTQLAHLEENVGAGAIVLSPTQRVELDSVVDALQVHGLRYNAATQAEIDTEQFPHELGAAP